MKGKDMKAIEKTWMDMRGNELKQKEKATSISKVWPPKGVIFFFTPPGLLAITFWRKMNDTKWWRSDILYWHAMIIQHRCKYHSSKYIIKAWKGHERKRSDCTCYEMDRNERAGNDNKKTLFPKGWKTLATTTTPSRITSLGSHRRTPLPDRPKARFKSFFNGGSRKKEVWPLDLGNLSI